MIVKALIVQVDWWFNRLNYRHCSASHYSVLIQNEVRLSWLIELTIKPTRIQFGFLNLYATCLLINVNEGREFSMRLDLHVHQHHIDISHCDQVADMRVLYAANEVYTVS